MTNYDIVFKIWLHLKERKGNVIMTEIKREVITKKYRKVINTCKGFGVF
jgi:hypothetical protein